MFNLISRFNIVFAILIGMILWPFILGVGPVIESKIAPVVSRGVITKIVNNNDTYQSMDFWYKARRLRSGCNYDHVEWFSGDPDGAHSRLTMTAPSNEGVILKQGEEYVFGPNRVFINETQLRTNTFAIAYHDCHPLWLSESILYP